MKNKSLLCSNNANTSLKNSHLDTNIEQTFKNDPEEYANSKTALPSGGNKQPKQININELLLLVFDKHKSLTELKPSRRQTRDPEFTHIIEENITNRLTTEQLSRLCHMCLSTFKPTFRRIYGDSPHHWIMSRRLEMVEKLLVQNNAPIKSISYECGFGSPSQMIRLFRKRYGTTPKQYRHLNSHNNK